jgi:sulfopyruvate decarboxylase subunit alpha
MAEEGCLMATRTMAGLVDALDAAGVDFVASLPDSRIAPLIEAVQADGRFRHVALTREDEGVGVCAGAWFGGATPALLIQNSGLLESVNDLVTLSIFSQVPLLLVVAYRGYLGEAHWYHGPVGRVTTGVLDALSIPYAVADDPGAVPATLSRARLLAETSSHPVAVLLTLNALDGGNAPD